MVAQIAARQHGVVRLAQLLWAGLNHEAVAWRVKAKRLHRLYRGVYAVGHVGLSEKGHMLAAVYACGDGSALNLWHCAWHWNVSRFGLPARIDVVVPRQCRPRPPVRAHECRGLDRRDITLHQRIPVTRVSRLLVDLSDVLTPFQLAYVIHEAAFRGLFSVAATRDAIARANGRHHLKRLERAIELHLSGSAGTKSNGEDNFLRRTEGRVEEPLVGTHLLNEEVDFHWPSRRLVVEIDGSPHGRPPTRRDDARRDAKLAAAGLTVLRLRDGASLDRFYATYGASSVSVTARGATRPAAA